MFPLEKGMATHSSVLAWRIPRTEEPGGLQPMGLQRDRTEHSYAPGTEPHAARYKTSVRHSAWFIIYKRKEA